MSILCGKLIFEETLISIFATLSLLFTSVSSSLSVSATENDILGNQIIVLSDKDDMYLFDNDIEEKIYDYENFFDSTEEKYPPEIMGDEDFDPDNINPEYFIYESDWDDNSFHLMSANGTGIYKINLSDTSSHLYVRSGPGQSYSTLGRLSHGNTAYVAEVSANWGRINYQGNENAWICLDYATWQAPLMPLGYTIYSSVGSMYAGDSVDIWYEESYGTSCNASIVVYYNNSYFGKYDIGSKTKQDFQITNSGTFQFYLILTNESGTFEGSINNGCRTVVVYDKISYDANGGSGAPAYQTKTYGVALTLSSTIPKRTGYTFLGWSTNSTAASATYSAGASYTDNSSVTLYAVWKINTCTVTYNYSYNGGTSATKNSVAITSGSNADLTPTATKTGWTFVGWNTNPDATTALSSYTVNANTTLYAIYRKVLTAKFHSKANNLQSTQTSTIYNRATSGSVTAPIPASYSGWTASGWRNDTTAASGTYSGGTSISLSSDANYYATYSRTLALSYNANGGSNTPSSQTATQYYNAYGNKESKSFTLASAISRSGYTFNKWAVGSVNGTTYNAGGSISISDDATMYAMWDAIPQPINSTMKANIENADIADFTLSFNEGQSVYAEVANTSGSVINGTVIEVFKDNYENILKIQTKDVIIEGDTYDFYDETDVQTEIATVDLYLWDKPDGMIPLAKKTLVWDGESVKEISDTYNYQINNGIISMSVDCFVTDEQGIVSITESNNSNISDTVGAIGNAVDITLSTGIVRQADISFEYDVSKLGSTVEDDLGIAWFNPKLGRMELLTDCVIDKSNSIITAHTNHFSEYVVVDTNEWRTQWAKSQMIIRDTTSDNTSAFEVVFAIDVSGSMSSSDVKFAKEAVYNFIKNLQPQDRFSVVKFGSNASNVIEKQKVADISDWDRIYNTIMNFSTGGNTNLKGALDLSYKDLNIISDSEQMIVLLSDGHGDTTISQSLLQNTSKIKILTIGLGNNVDTTTMQNLALWTNGQYVYTKNSSDLDSLYEQLRGEFIGYDIDTDGDGIPDKIETSGMRDQYGNFVCTDPDDADTDGDGLNDGVEMGKLVVEEAYPYATYFKRYSDPNVPTNVGGAEFEINQMISINSNYDGISDTVTLYSKEDAKTAFDYLSETVHGSVNNFIIEIEVPDCIDYPGSMITSDGALVAYTIGDGKFRLNYTVNPGDTLTFNIDAHCVNGGKLKCDNNHFINIKVSGNSITPTESKRSIDFLEQWKYEQGVLEKRIAHQILQETIAEKTAESKKQENLNNNISKFINSIDGSTDSSMKDIAIKAYEQYIGTLSSELPSLSLDEAKTIKEIGNHFNGANETFKIEYYTVHITGLTWNTTGLLLVKCIDNQTNKQATYSFTSTPDAINKVIKEYIWQLKKLSIEADKKVLTAATKDSLSVLGVYELLESFSKGDISESTRDNINYLSNAVSIGKSRTSMSGSKLISEYKKYKSQVESYNKVCSTSLKSLTETLIDGISKMF